MKESLLRRLEGLAERHAEITALLAEPDVIADQERFRAYSIEYSRLGPLVSSLGAWRRAQDDLAAARDMAGDADPEMRALADAEIAAAEGRIAALETELIVHLTPPDPHDESNVFLEIRAGTGGDEAALFAGDLFRMYSRYAEARGWRVEILSENPGEHGGYREIVARVVGRGVWSRLKFESGAHRVQRVPETEAQGRIHTSAATVAVMAEPDELEIPEINPADLRIDTYRASGAGGQHVNRTESAIRITHLPTGFVVECQDDRSQHKNRARAMGLLAAKIREAEEARRHARQAETRKRLVGSGDRSERIRTYNFPQGRLSDHRINLTLYQLDAVMAGDLDPVIEPLVAEDRAEQLAAMGE